MISEAEIEEKLRDLASSFYVHFWNKKYAQAKHCYDKAVTITTFLDLPIKFRIELFGNRSYVDDEKEIKDGLFREEDVQKAYLHYIKTEGERLADEKARYIARRQ